MNYLCLSECNLLDCSFLVGMLFTDFSLTCTDTAYLWTVNRESHGGVEGTALRLSLGQPLQCEPSCLMGSFAGQRNAQLFSETSPLLSLEAQGQGHGS